MVMTFSPQLSWGFFFLFHAEPSGQAAPIGMQQGHCIVGNNDFKPIAFGQFTAAEFARLSPSMQLTLLIIRRAQLSSRKAIAATGQRKRQRGNF
jgi:hypothetical protein